MREFMGFLYDSLKYTIIGILLIFLLQGMVQRAGCQRDGRGKHFFLITQYVILQVFLHSWMIENELIRFNNRNTAGIIIIFISMCITMAAAIRMYQKEKKLVLYLIVTFYALVELTRLIVQPVLSFGLTVITDRIVVKIGSEDSFVIENINRIFEILQFTYSLILDITILIILYILIRWLKRNIGRLLEQMSHTELFFLIVPVFIGLGIGILLRMSMFYMDEEMIFSLMENYKVTYLLIPLLSVLCIASIFLSILTLGKLIKSNEQALQAEIYKNRMQDMEEHMKDVSHLYDGIRGMKHDMKNYIADMEALMKNQSAEKNQSLQMYLNSLCQSVEALDMKCNTGNPVSDVVITRWMHEAEKYRIPMQCDFIYPDGFGTDAFDISIILNNALENAIESSKQQEIGARITVESYCRENMFFLEIANYFTGHICLDAEGKNLVSTKPEKAQHGLGMKNIESCANKYFGKAEWTVAENWFRLTVMLQKREVG